MTPNEFESPRPAGSGRGNVVRQARMARVRMIRRRVVGGAATVFVAAWLLIAVVLVSGHDPALARKTASTSAVTGTSSASTTPATSTSATTTSPSTTASGTTSSGTTSSGTTSSGTSSSGSTGSAGTSSQTGGTTSSVTTKQS
jgi:hypothetical protein